MSYAILHVVYGFPINDKQRKIIKKMSECELAGLSNDEIDELENGKGVGAIFGFTSLYCAGGDDDIGFCGVELDRCTEGEDLRVSQLSKYKPTQAQRIEVDGKISALRPELQEVADPIDIWIVWGSS